MRQDAPRDRLGGGPHRDGGAQAPGRRGPPGRARRDRRHARSTSSAATRARAARPAGRDRRPARRRDLPRDRRRRGLDHPPQGRRRRSFKLPADRARSRAPASALDAPEVPAALHAPGPTYRELAYEEAAGVGYLHFDFYNGAMSTEQCRRLREAYRYARSRRETQRDRADGRRRLLLQRHPPQRHRGRTTTPPASRGATCTRSTTSSARSSRPIRTSSISALSGDAAAGGVPLALAADRVVAREDVVLNPYYRHMGGLYGSEYWTYLLPRRVGAAMAARLTERALHARSAPGEAVEIGLLDATFGATAASFRARRARRRRAARPPPRAGRPARARSAGAARRDELIKPLQAYRTEEMARSHRCFFGPDRSYHEARRRFVRKLGAACSATRTDASAARWFARDPCGARSASGRRTASPLARGQSRARVRGMRSADRRTSRARSAIRSVPGSGSSPSRLRGAACPRRFAAPRDDARVQRGLERLVDSGGGPLGAIATFHRGGRTTVMTAGVRVAGHPPRPAAERLHADRERGQGLQRRGRATARPRRAARRSTTPSPAPTGPAGGVGRGDGPPAAQPHQRRARTTPRPTASGAAETDPRDFVAPLRIIAWVAPTRSCSRPARATSTRTPTTSSSG